MQLAREGENRIQAAVGAHNIRSMPRVASAAPAASFSPPIRNASYSNDHSEGQRAIFAAHLDLLSAASGRVVSNPYFLPVRTPGRNVRVADYRRLSRSHPERRVKGAGKRCANSSGQAPAEFQGPTKQVFRSTATRHSGGLKTSAEYPYKHIPAEEKRDGMGTFDSIWAAGQWES